jgi:hypothetical protein
VVLDWVALVLASSRVAKASLIHPAINSLPDVPGEISVKGRAHVSVEDCLAELPGDFVEVQAPGARRRVTSEVSRSSARQIVLMFGAYNVFYFSGHHFEVCP